MQELYIFFLIILMLFIIPTIFKDLTKTPIGKLILIVALIYIAHNHGLVQGVLGALIVILVLNDVVEGVDDTLEKDPKESEDNDNESDNDAETADNDDDDDNDTEQDENIINNDADDVTNQSDADQIDNRELLKADVNPPEPEKITNENNDDKTDEPVGVAMDSKSKEGFSTFY